MRRLLGFIIYIIIFNFSFLIFNFDKAEASALSLGISPPVIKIALVPPAESETPLSIQNLADTPVNLNIIFKPITQSETEKGEVSYKVDEGGFFSLDAGIFEKIKVYDGEEPIKNIILGPKQNKILVLKVQIPKEQKEADYYFSVVFIASSEQVDKNPINGPFIEGGVGTNVLLSIVPSDRIETKATIIEFSVPSFLEKGPVGFTLRLKNNGAHVISPTGVILIRNMFGQTIGKIQIPPTNILAGTARAISVSWPETFLLGPYNATLTVSLSDKGPTLQKSIYFLAFPSRFLIGIIAVIIALIVLKNRIRRSL